MTLRLTERYTGPALLKEGFRPAFLLAAFRGIATLVLWLGFVSGFWLLSGVFTLLDWHRHELLYDYTGAIVGGFLLNYWCYKNLGVLLVVSLFAFGNGVFHAEAAAGGSADIGSRIGIATLLTLFLVIAGRIIPAFTRNWLIRVNSAARPVLPRWRSHPSRQVSCRCRSPPICGPPVRSL